MDYFKNLESILRCPISDEELRYTENVDRSEIIRDLKDKMDVNSGFINKSKTAFYPVKNNIVCMLTEYA